MSLLAPGIPLSLYIHLPWCLEKCPYCDFNSHKISDNFNEQIYINNLFHDVEEELPRVWGRTVETVYIGGGTPSLFTGESINELLSGMRSRLILRADPEITMESNPGTTDSVNYRNYRQAGINRLSIGVQSFNDNHLARLGRIHNAHQAEDAFYQARDAGFERINIDLMFALPSQTIDEAMNDLDKAISLQPEHISWYQLTVEPNTVFYNTPPVIPDDDLVWEIQQTGMKKLNQAGYEQYEISAWCKTTEQCQHNLNYWQFGDYLGIGAGAHGKITDLAAGEIYRTQRKKQPSYWLVSKNKTLAVTKSIARHELALEFMINVLRLNAGVPAHIFTQRTGLPLIDIIEPLRQAQEQGLLKQQSDLICATEKGLTFLNDLLNIFVIDTPKAHHKTIDKPVPLREIS